MTIIDAYFAGFIDGEGNIAATQRNGSKTLRLRPRIQVSNTNKAVLDALQSTYGGFVIVKNHKNPHWKPQWIWRADYAVARSALTRMLPYLRVKKQDAENLLALPIRPKGRPRLDSSKS